MNVYPCRRCGKLDIGAYCLDCITIGRLLKDDMIEYEGGADLEDVKLSGLEPEMTEEEYRRLFNLARTSLDVTTELQPEIEGARKTGKSFADMTMEEKTDHIEFLSRCMRKIKIFKNSAALAKQEALMALSEEERVKVRDYDKKYKPKPRTAENEEKRSPAERKAMSPEEKFIEMLTKSLGSREQAIKFVEAQKKAKG